MLLPDSDCPADTMNARETHSERAKLTEKKYLCRLLTLFDEFLGFLETFVNLSGNSGGLFLLLDALRAFALGLFGWRHEDRNEWVVIPEMV